MGWCWREQNEDANPQNQFGGRLEIGN